MKIGLGIVTYNRIPFLIECIKSLPKGKYDYLVIVNDGGESVRDAVKDLVKCELIELPKNKGVAGAKNTALEALLKQKDIDDFFLLEDDILIKRPDVFEVYTKTAKKTGILHFNYGPGSPFNRKQDPNIRMDLDTRHLLEQSSEPNPRLVVDYGDNVKVALYLHTVAMFSYFNRKVLEQVGLMDERFSQYQSWEHVEHTQRIANAKLHTPFWWFADINNSWEYLTEAPEAINSSAIAKNKNEWMEKVMKGRELYKSIHGWYPNHAPMKSEQEVIQFLKEIKPNE